MPARTETRPWDILLAEDNQADVYLIVLALEEQRLEVEFQVLENGEQTLARWHLVETGRMPTPDLVLLDLNLPLVSGHDVLRRIRSRQDFASVPVVVLTSSDSQLDRSVAMELGATAYIRKPSSLDGYMEVGKQIRAYLE